jgi:hypothetical protein
MNHFSVKNIIFAIIVVFANGAMAENNHDERFGYDMDSSLTIAVFGDWPYNQNLLDNAPLLINSVNADKSVDLVLHVGDIHSGNMPCTSSGILPALASANPEWNQKIYYDFQQFKAPLVYTPGDNEWTDCHKAKEKSSGDPLKELASIRNLFFAKPGFTLGVNERRVLSQALYFDPVYPADAQLVENVMWQQARILFVTLNMPGSNNDTVPWSGVFSNPAAQAQEVADRTAANIRWLQAAFNAAEESHVRALVVALQADMFDPAAIAAGEDGLNNYTQFVKTLADLSVHFNRPVLLLNGDSHVYGSDFPLADPNSSTGVIHHTQSVPKLQRITVQGSTNAPSEWLRLKIDTRHNPVFTWSNVAYCKDPLTSCQ